MITVASLIYYPIKSCRGIEVNEANVERMGLEGDRRMMVVTPKGGFLTQRDHPRLALVSPFLASETLTLSAPGMQDLTIPLCKSGQTTPVDIWRSKGVLAVDQGRLAAAWFSDWLETEVRLVHFAEGYVRKINEKYAVNPDDHTGFADGYPILLASEESLEDLNARLEWPLPMNRFRPNLVVRGGEPFAEDGWDRIRSGDIEMAVVKPCARCLITTIDKETLEKSKEPLKTLATYRRQEGGVMFGQNVIPRNEGKLEVGMKLEILSTKESHANE